MSGGLGLEQRYRRVLRLLPGYYRDDPHLIAVSLTELVILLATAALVAPDAARAQAATPAPPYPGTIAA